MALFLSIASAEMAAHAAIPEPAGLSETDRATLRAIEAYLNSIRTVQARFSQVSSNGGQAEGSLYLSRPGKLRVEYDPPSPILVIADGRFLIYVDQQLDQYSYIPLDVTPAGILLDKRIALQGGDVVVTDFVSDGDTVRVSLVRAKEPGEGSLTLVFSGAPPTLQEWEVTDAQGIVTTVSLNHPKFGVKLDSNLFYVRNPNLPK
jgi:outer membrane lipoprotein-sorting protein